MDPANWTMCPEQNLKSESETEKHFLSIRVKGKLQFWAEGSKISNFVTRIWTSSLRPGRALGADKIADFQLIWVFYANLSTLCSKFCAALRSTKFDYSFRCHLKIKKKGRGGQNPYLIFHIFPKFSNITHKWNFIRDPYMLVKKKSEV